MKLNKNVTSAVSMLKLLVWVKAVAEKKATLMKSLEGIFAVRRVWVGESEEIYWNKGKGAYGRKSLEERRRQKGVYKSRAKLVFYLVRCDSRDFVDGQRVSPQRIVQKLFCFGD